MGAIEEIGSAKNNIAADYTSQTLIDFDWCNNHPYQRTTRNRKNFDSPVIFHHIKAIVELSINA